MDYGILEILNKIVQVIDLVPIKIKCVHPTYKSSSNLQKCMHLKYRRSNTQTFFSKSDQQQLEAAEKPRESRSEVS